MLDDLLEITEVNFFTIAEINREEIHGSAVILPIMILSSIAYFCSLV